MTLQSYNHIFPQSIIKHGWGIKYSKNKEKSVLVLNMNILYEYLKDKNVLIYSDVKIFLSKNFGENSEKGGVISRRNPDSIFGNKLVENLTENNFGSIGKQIEREIESVMLNAIKYEAIIDLDINKIYEWFSLQISRSLITLDDILKICSTYRKVQTLNEYLDFKNSYNSMLQIAYNSLMKRLGNEEYRVVIMNFKSTDGDNCFQYLGHINTLCGYMLSGVILHNDKILKRLNCSLKNTDYLLLNYIYVSMLGKNQAIFLVHKKIKNEEFERISFAISKFWNAYQLSHELDTLIVDHNKENCIKFLLNFLCFNDIKIIKHNLKNRQEYKNLIVLSNKYENELKEND